MLFEEHSGGETMIVVILSFMTFFGVLVRVEEGTRKRIVSGQGTFNPAKRESSLSRDNP